MRCLRATMVVRLGEGMSRWRSGREALNLTVRWREGWRRGDVEDGLFGTDEVVFVGRSGDLEVWLEGERSSQSSLIVSDCVWPLEAIDLKDFFKIVVAV